MIKRGQFLKDSMIYWLGRMGARAVSFLLLPIYTAYIIPAEWGILNLLMISGDLAVLLVLCQIPAALYRFWVSAETEEKKQHLSGAGLVFPVLLSCLVFLPIYLYADQCAKFMGIEGYGNYLRILLFTEQLAVILNVIQAEMRLRNEAKLFALLEIGQNFGSAALNIFFVAVCGWGIWGILFGQMLTFLVIVALMLPRFKRRTELNCDRDLLKALLLFSTPLVPSALAMSAIHSIDRYFLQFMQGADIVGIYSIGYKFGTLVNVLILGPFLLIWQPKSYELAKSKQAAKTFGKVFSYLLALLLFACVALSGTSKEIVQLMTAEKYHAAYQVIPLVALSYLFFGMDSIVKVGLLLHRRTKVIMFIVLAVCLINITGNWLLIPRMGMLGAAWSTLISFAFLFLFDLFFSRKYLSIAYEWKQLCKVTAISIAVVAMVLTVQVSNLQTAIILKGFILLSFPLLLVISGFITKDNMKLFQEIIRKKKI